MLTKVPPHVFNIGRLAQVLVDLVSSSTGSDAVVLVYGSGGSDFDHSKGLPLAAVSLDEKVNLVFSSVLLALDDFSSRRDFKAELVRGEREHSESVFVPLVLVLSHLLIVHLSHSSFGSHVHEKESLGIGIDKRA